MPSIVRANRASVLLSGWLRKARCQCDCSEDSASSWSSRLPSVSFAAKSLNRSACTTILPTIFSYPLLRPRLEECRRPAERQMLGKMRPRQPRSQAFPPFVVPSPHSLPGRISCGCSPFSGNRNNHSSHLAPFACAGRDCACLWDCHMSTSPPQWRRCHQVPTPSAQPRFTSNWPSHKNP